jgi:hypothetical protein
VELKGASQRWLIKPASLQVIVDFSAVWCGPCQMIGPYFGQLSTQYGNVVFLKVDVDANGVSNWPGSRSHSVEHLQQLRTQRKACATTGLIGDGVVAEQQRARVCMDSAQLSSRCPAWAHVPCCGRQGIAQTHGNRLQQSFDS